MLAIVSALTRAGAAPPTSVSVYKYAGTFIFNEPLVAEGRGGAGAFVEKEGISGRSIPSAQCVWI